MIEVQERLRTIEESIQAVEDSMPDSYEEFTRLSKVVKDGVYKNIEIISEMFVDLCYLLVKHHRLTTPEDDLNAIDILMRENILSVEQGEKIKEVRGFRNILVHRYGKINEELAYENIKDGIDDLKTIYEFFTETFEK